jgi:hypothetical protein
MKVYESSSVNVVFDEKTGRLFQNWDGFSTSETFREAIDATVRFAKTNKVKTILSDTLNQKVVKPSDSDYASSVIPALFGCGVKAMAFVMPLDVLNKLSLGGFSKKEKNDKVDFFPSLSAANSWLDSIK